MKITKAEFITSVASADKFYKTDKPIIAIAGKSNVGKSSLINMLANQKKLAKTSVTPGSNTGVATLKPSALAANER